MILLTAAAIAAAVTLARGGNAFYALTIARALVGVVVANARAGRSVTAGALAVAVLGLTAVARLAPTRAEA